ncbi:MAG: nucleoside hydrolase [Clostridia bacterium]|nr:nucleoside hydrolase [Clostridia bacterium]MBR7097914.1 nucleoside hydrolase [Clostridia bacterium]
MKKIILDTDIGGDCDDAGALALLHRLCDLGECELLATTHCYSSPYVGGCLDAINTYFGRAVPVGINHSAWSDSEGVYAKALYEHFPHIYPDAQKIPDSVEVIRSTLARSENHSVTLVVIGDMRTIARLLQSAPDAISPLSGKELIAQKIDRTVIMGGRFFESWPMIIHADNKMDGKAVDWEWNIHGAISDAQFVCDNWPGKLVFSSYEIGNYIKTMVGYPERVTLSHPVGMAYELHNHGKGRCSWDHTAVLEAIRPDRYWSYHADGHISVDDEGITHWHRAENGKHTYLLPKVDYEEIREVIDSIVS